jgi:hypothetical protein
MFFTNPIWLWALGGLSIPIAIHLLSRKEGKVIYLGSLRYLEESNTRQFRALRLNEILLLLIRSLLIITVVLLLAGLSLHHQDNASTKWVVLEPGLKQEPATTTLLDSLEKNGFEKHYLSRGFPVKTDSLPRNVQYWSLIAELKEKSLDTVIVFSHSQWQHFTGEQTLLPSNTRWITVPSPAREVVLFSQPLSSDSVLIRKLRLSETETQATYQRVAIAAFPDSTVKLEPRVLHVTLAFDPEFTQDASVADASLQALNTIPGVQLDIEKIPAAKIQDTKADWKIIFAKESPALDNVNQVVLKENAGMSRIIQQVKSQPFQQWTITKRLTEDIALRENFTIQLASVLLNNEVVRDAYQKNDARALPEHFLKTDRSRRHVAINTTSAQSAAPLLIVLLLGLFLLERLVSHYRNQ